MTATTTRKGRTPEQKREEMKALHDRLTASVEELRSSERWTAYLRLLGSFHSYSPSNLLLIWSQCEDATYVAGYRAWQAKGRQVRKGERAIRILGSGLVKRTDASADEDGQDDEATGRRRVFFPLSVFDISQTDPMDGHEDVTTMAPVLTGQDEAGIFARVAAYLEDTGVPVEVRDIVGSAQGFTVPANPHTGAPISVTIEARNEPAHQAKTLIHEAAHIALGHVEGDALAEYEAHRGRCEVEAESVAYVMAGMLGLDTSSYSTGYIAGWMQAAPADVLRETAAHVLTVCHTLANALIPQDDDATSDTTA